MNTNPQPPFSLPHRQNPLFVGRETELADLETWLAPEGATVAVCGTGGVGKSQLVTEYAYRAWKAGRYPGGVFWLVMADPAGVGSQVAALAGPEWLALPGYDPGQAEQNVGLVKRAWREEIDRLLVFDNVEERDAAALLNAWRPPVGGCRVLITSRATIWPAALGVRPLRLGTLPRPDSLALLLTPCAGRQGCAAADLLADETTARAADALCEWLGDLPLALALAAAYLESHPSVTLDYYLHELEETKLRHPSLDLSLEQQAIIGHDPSLWYTFLRSEAALDDRDPTDALALTLLHRAAQCAPGVPIPRRLLVRAARLDPDVADASRQADAALGRLASLGLIKEEADGSVGLHRLLAAYAGGRAPALAVDMAAVENALDWELYYINEAGYPQAGVPYLAHGWHAAAEYAHHGDAKAAFLLNELGRLLKQQGDYGAARSLYERALTIREQALGSTHLHTANSLNNLGALLYLQEDYAVARPLLERALAIREQALGPTHPTTAASLNNLAELLRAQGEYIAAYPLYERVINIFEQVFGSTRPKTATSLNNLAGLLYSQGEYAAARPLLERALAIYEQTLGPTHPTTAYTLNNLAGLMKVQGDYIAARPLYEQALAIFEQALGLDHPNTRTVRENLAALLDKIGEEGRPTVEPSFPPPPE